MEEDGSAAAPTADASFEQAASRAGLVLPPRRRLNPWLAVGIVVVLVGASVGIGDLTGWAIGPRETGTVGIYGAQQCANVPSYLSVYLTVSVSAHADPALHDALAGWATDFSEWSGGCVHVVDDSGTGDGYVPDLASDRVEAVVSSALPDVTDRGSLGSAVSLFPEAANPISIVYDLPGLTGPLRLTGSVLAGLFDGAITSWDDPSIATLNPGADLGSAPPVTPVYRSDASGANAALTGFLATSSPTWNRSVGVGEQPAWPDGLAANGSAAMSAALAATPGAVGYLEAGEAVPANSSVALIENPAGEFVAPSPVGASAAAAAHENGSAAKRGDWANDSLVASAGASSYPITEFVYFAVYHDLGTAYSDRVSMTNATWLLTFLWWLAVDAGSDVRAAGLGAVPTTIVGLDEVGLENVTYNGGSLLENNEGGSEGGETGEF